MRFDVPGEYGMTYWVYFDTSALKGWADENGVSLDVPDADRLAVSVRATVTVTEAEEEDAEETEEDEDTGDAETETENGSAAAAATGSVSGSVGSTSDGTGTASGNGSSGGGGSGGTKSSGGSSSSACDHDWVDTGHYESVLVKDAYDEKVSLGEYYVCYNCGFYSRDSDEISGHCYKDGKSPWSVKTVYETVHHDAEYEDRWASSYQCSKCGATK